MCSTSSKTRSHQSLRSLPHCPLTWDLAPWEFQPWSVIKDFLIFLHLCRSVNAECSPCTLLGLLNLSLMTRVNLKPQREQFTTLFKRQPQSAGADRAYSCPPRNRFKKRRRLRASRPMQRVTVEDELQCAFGFAQEVKRLSSALWTCTRSHTSKPGRQAQSLPNLAFFHIPLYKADTSQEISFTNEEAKINQATVSVQ